MNSACSNRTGWPVRVISAACLRLNPGERNLTFSGGSFQNRDFALFYTGVGLAHLFVNLRPTGRWTDEVVVYYFFCFWFIGCATFHSSKRKKKKNTESGKYWFGLIFCFLFQCRLFVWKTVFALRIFCWSMNVFIPIVLLLAGAIGRDRNEFGTIPTP